MDAWTWVAWYDDGSCVRESDPYGDHGFADVDLQRVRSLELLAVDAAAGLNSYCLLVDPEKGQVPIFYRTRASAWLLAGGEPETVMTCIGRRDAQGETYVFLDGRGRAVITDRPLS